MKKNSVARIALMGFGWLALGLGSLGLVLPILPTAPFVLVAAACFMRSSERLHTWVTEHPVFGKHVSDYLAGEGLQLRTKVVALTTLWASILVSAVVLVPLVIADALLILVAVLVTAYIVRLPTCDS